MIPAPSELRPCDHCTTPVLWTVTEARRRLPVDPHPDPGGNTACYRVRYGVWASRSLDGADAPPPAAWEHLYRPHTATCTPTALQGELPLAPTTTKTRRTKRRAR